MTLGINANLCQTVLLSDPAESVYTTGIKTTTATTRTTVLEHTVASGKDFYIFAYSINKETNNSAGSFPSSLEVKPTSGSSVVYDTGSIPDGSANSLPNWSESRDTGVKIATAGQKVQLWVSPTRTTSTVWFGKIIGVEK